MSIPLRQNTASQEIALGYFLDSTDGNTEEAGLTIANTDIKLFKGGATSLVSKNSGGATHMANGVYSAVLDATDTNTLGPLVIFVHVAGALAVRLECMVLTQANYDAAVAGSAAAAANLTQVNGVAVTSSGGRPEVNTTHWGGTPVASATAAIADAVWDEALAGHLGAGSTGAALNGAGAAGDPWTTTLPGAYGVGTAGNIIGNNLDATVSSRLVTASYTAPPTAIENADALLGRDLGSGVNAGALNERTVRSALRYLRNKWTIVAGALTVYKENDTTSAWSGATTETPGDSSRDPS